MDLKLMYITNQANIAKLAQDGGVDRIFIDLEVLGKEERQGHIDSVKSRHSLDDVSAVRKVLTTAELLVRINPIHENSQAEINEVIARGADIVMLPMFTTKAEVETFLRLVDGRAKTMLLLETKLAYENIHDILSCHGIDEVHIGLNDLHLCYGLTFMFQLVANGVVDDICRILRQHNIPYGFGGIGRIGYGLLPAEQILCEHCRLGSSMVILARAFLNTTNGTSMSDTEMGQYFADGVAMIRSYETLYRAMDDAQLAYMHRAFSENTNSVVKKIQGAAG